MRDDLADSFLPAAVHPPSPPTPPPICLNPLLCPWSQEVPAGCVVAIGGLDTAILKSATLAGSPAARPLAPMLFQVNPKNPCSFDCTLRLPS